MLPHRYAPLSETLRWLADLGLEQYSEAFAENAIDGDILKTLNEEDLKELGVKALGHRKKLLAAIALLTEKPTPPTGLHDKGQRAIFRAVAVLGRAPPIDGDVCRSRRIHRIVRSLDPEEMAEVIRAYQNAVAGEITRVDGHVAKFMGDGVLAYFGWPRAHEDEAERAVRAGLAISRGGRPPGDAWKEPLPPRSGLPRAWWWWATSSARAPHKRRRWSVRHRTLPRACKRSPDRALS